MGETAYHRAGRLSNYRIFVPGSFRGPILCSVRAFAFLSNCEKKTQKNKISLQDSNSFCPHVPFPARGGFWGVGRSQTVQSLAHIILEGSQLAVSRGISPRFYCCL